MNLTTKETACLIACWKSSKGNGHDFGYGSDLEGIGKASRGGLMASLQAKGLIDIQEAFDDGVTQFLFTDAGKALFTNFSSSPELRSTTMTATTKTEKATKSTKSTKSTKAEKASAGKTATVTPEKAPRAKKEGMRKPQVRILKALAKAKGGLTRSEIAEKAGVDVAWLVTWMGSVKADVRKANDAKHFPSLVSLGYAKHEVKMVEEKEVVTHVITPSGRKALEAAEKAAK